MLRRFRWLAVPLLALGFCAPAQAAAPYLSPLPAADYFVGRTDMGVDICMAAGDPIVAIGDGIVIGVQRNWFEHQPYLWYELTDGPYAGRYVYVAEQITPAAKAGDQLTVGETIAHYARKGTCIETGWAAADGETLAAATTGYSEGQVTDAGVSFARFLIAEGVQGTFELSAPPPKASAHKKARKPVATPAPKPHSGPTGSAPRPSTHDFSTNHPSGGSPPPASTGGVSGAGGTSGASSGTSSGAATTGGGGL